VPVAPSYVGPDQRHFFTRWLNEVVANSKVSKLQIAAALGHDTTQQLNKFLHGTAMPMPETLRKICDCIGVPWTMAYAHAGYYGEILGILALLSRLADKWLKEDGALPDRAQFRQGVLQMDDLPVWEAIQQPRFAARYTAGSWVEQPPLPPSEADFEKIVPEHREVFKKLYEEESKEPRTIWCFVPKPLGLAILIAVAGFTRRGDIYKSGADRYAADIFAASTKLIELAEQTIVQPYTLPPLLLRAEDTLKDRELSFELRRVISAEYVVKWADRECELYTHIVRLAALEYFGVAGSSMDNLTPEMQLPHIRAATLPPIAEFSDLTEKTT
jgi:transcriptional regulator with XRE-family HTH domain